MKYLIPVLFLISCSTSPQTLPYVYTDTVSIIEVRTDSVVHMMDEKLEYYKQKKAAEKRAMDSMKQVNKLLQQRMEIQKQRIETLIELDTATLQ